MEASLINALAKIVSFLSQFFSEECKWSKDLFQMLYVPKLRGLELGYVPLTIGWLINLLMCFLVICFFFNLFEISHLAMLKSCSVIWRWVIYLTAFPVKRLFKLWNFWLLLSVHVKSRYVAIGKSWPTFVVSIKFVYG